MLVSALDISLTAIGIAKTRKGAPPWCGVLSPGGRGAERLDNAVRLVVPAVRGSDVVVIEGHAFHGNPKRSRPHSMGEMVGVIKLGIYQLDPRPQVIVVPPARAKMFATGNGHAKKEQMIAAARADLGYGRHQDDEADALWLLHTVLAKYDLPGRIEVTDPQRTRALAGDKWPPLYTGPRLAS